MYFRYMVFKRGLLILLAVLSYNVCNSWGFFAHKSINRLAVFTLPKPLFGFFKQNIDYLTEHAVDADKRRYSAEGEAPRHYLDADHYEQVLPLDTIPRYWKDAVARFTEDTLQAYGIVPWHIQLMTYQLTEAYKEKNTERILRLSADIGHYIADCHVPLHTTENYNGQFSGQHGIHGFWESRLPELFSSEYDFFVGRASYLENMPDAIWDAFEASVAARDSVLSFEKELNNHFPPDKKYAFEDRGNANVKVYAYDYAKAYHTLLNGMVERRMRAAISLTGNIWYSCWINAGQPDLGATDQTEPSDQERQLLIEHERQFNDGKIIGRDEAP